jgi:hypothetical protein
MNDRLFAGRAEAVKRLSMLLAVLIPVSLFAVGCGDGTTAKVPEKSKADQEKFMKDRMAEMKGVKGVMKQPEAPK